MIDEKQDSNQIRQRESEVRDVLQDIIQNSSYEIFRIGSFVGEKVICPEIGFLIYSHERKYKVTIKEIGLHNFDHEDWADKKAQELLTRSICISIRDGACSILQHKTNFWASALREAYRLGFEEGKK